MYSQQFPITNFQLPIKSIGLYIHIPFCVQKCNYCAFSSFVVTSDEIKEKYVDKLVEEITFRTKDLGKKKVKWIYIGGGTPNTLSINQLTKIVNVLPEGFEELSIELNPGVLSSCYPALDVGSHSFLSDLKRMRFNRLSIGVQSFNDTDLKLLGRIHNSEVARDFLQNLKISGFNNFNIDLMIGLPNQSVETVLKNIETAASFDPTHISAYLLSIDLGTHFQYLYNKGLLKLPEDEELENIYFTSVEKLESLGFKQYEISNFAKQSFECKYNLNTWRNGDYIGCGLSAGNSIDGMRFENTNDFDEYLDNNVGAQNFVPLQKIENLETKILLGLRLREGVNVSDALEVLSQDYQIQFNQRLEKLIKDGLLERIGNSIQIPKGKILLLDTIIEKLLICLPETN